MASKRKLRSSTRADVLQLGRELLEAQEQKRVKEFCEERDLHIRKAYDLIDMTRAVDEGFLQPRDVERIGWAKASLIASKRTALGKRGTRQAITYAARPNTLPALARYLRGDQLEEGLVTKSFHLSPDEADQLESVLALAGGKVLRGDVMAERSKRLMRIVRAYKRTSSRRGA